MQTKWQLKRCTRNVHPSFDDFRPGLGVNFHILLTQNWLWESSLSLLSLWCILFQIKLGLFRENLNLKKHLRPKNGWSSPRTFWHRLICFSVLQALPMVTVIVGRKTEGSTCRVHTLAQGADEPTYTEFPSKGLSPGTPKWANYVKGVVDKFPGAYSVPTLYFVLVRCIQGRQC